MQVYLGSDERLVAETVDVQWKKGVLDMCVLAILSQRDRYAYEIASSLGEAIGMGEGTVYPLMRRFKAAGWVTTYLVETANGPPRKYYKLTSAGKHAFATRRHEWLGFAGAVSLLLEAT